MPLQPGTNKEQVLSLVPLQPGSSEYQDVKAKFDKTMRIIPAATNVSPQAGLWTPGAKVSTLSASRLYVTGLSQSDTYSSVVKIERIQNPALYSQYVARKRQMDKQNPQGHQNERLLFHGTAINSCGSINHGGFNRSFSGKNGERVSN